MPAHYVTSPSGFSNKIKSVTMRRKKGQASFYVTAKGEATCKMGPVPNFIQAPFQGPFSCRSNFFYLDNVFLSRKVLPYNGYFSGGGYETS